MKGNNGTGNNTERDEWETPQWLFNELNKQYNFQLDCCATAENKKCMVHTDNFLDLKTINVVAWMNPPFSKATRMFQHFLEIVTCGVAIYRSDNLETRIYQNLILKKANWIHIIKGRINYEGMKGKGARFPSILIGKGVQPPRNIPGITCWIKKV